MTPEDIDTVLDLVLDQDDIGIVNEWPKRCGCGRSYTAHEWRLLEIAGTMVDDCRVARAAQLSRVQKHDRRRDRVYSAPVSVNSASAYETSRSLTRIGRRSPSRRIMRCGVVDVTTPYMPA